MADKIRSRWVELAAKRISWPRLQVTLMLMLTALCAFFTSAFLLEAEVYSMAARYAAAVAVAYIVFLLMLRVWIWLNRNSADLSVPVDLPLNIPGGSAADAPSFNYGGGGDFAGAGAGGSWDSDVPAPSPVAFVSTSVPSPGQSVSSGGSGGGLSLDLDEAWLILLAVVVAIGGLLAVLYIVYAAPVLLAELAVDSLLAAGLYKTTKKIEPRYWLSTALRKTAIPAVLAMILFGTAGYLLQAAAPEARSIGEVWKNL